MFSTSKPALDDQRIRREIDDAVLCWLATVDKKGRPNVSPKQVFATHGGNRLVIADIASANSVRNIRANPQVCVSLIDVFRERGHKIQGVAEIVAPNEDAFPNLAADLLVMTGNRFPIRHVIAVNIERISPIRAPSYRLFPDRTEREMMEDAYATYGVRPIA